MEIDQLRQEINDLLDNIVEHSNSYSNNRPIPSLEASYVLSKVNKMHEKLTILKFLLEQKELANMASAKQLVRFSKMEGDDDDDWDDEVEQTEQPEPTPEVVVGQEEQVVDGIESTIHNEGNETIAENSNEEEPQSVSNIEALPIGKIIDALTLNDRYLYANELFEKDMNAFNELVKAIDNCSAIDEAKTIISDFEEKWDAENEHVISFFSLVERRFM